MIRRAQVKDTERVLELLEQVNRVHYEGRPDLFRPETKYSGEELSAIFGNDKTPVFVFENDEGCIEGYAFCILKQAVGDRLLTDIKTLYIDDLCVDEKSRGRHVGKALYEFVVEYARSIGCYNVTLNVWALNEGAMAFYRKCGLKVQKMGLETIL